MMRGGTYLHVKGEILKPFLPPQMPCVNMQRGPLTRLATARAIPWCRLLRFHVQMNGGWVKVANDMWAPSWMTIPQVSQSCQELLKCGCKSERGCAGRCKCVKAELPCTALCNCAGLCDREWTAECRMQMNKLRIGCIINNIPMNLCLAFASWFDVFRA